MNSNPPTLSIIIVNWNSKDYVRKCLLHLRPACAGISHQIIVVDGASFDGCDRMLASDFPEATYLQSMENVGFGQCNNLGFQLARGELVLLLNPDTEVHSDAVKLLMSQARTAPNAGIVGARLLNTDGTLQTSCVRAAPTPLNAAVDSEFLRRLMPRSRLWGTWGAFGAQEPVEVEAVSGACMMLRSELFREVGGFSPEFFMYGEDMDLCMKVRKAGRRNYFVPGASVVHHGGGCSQRQPSEFSTVGMRRAGETYMKLNHGEGKARLYVLLQGLSALVRLAALLPLRLLMVGRRRVAARTSARKWGFVLKWAVGSRPPTPVSKPPAARVERFGSHTTTA